MLGKDWWMSFQPWRVVQSNEGDRGVLMLRALMIPGNTCYVIHAVGAVSSAVGAQGPSTVWGLERLLRGVSVQAETEKGSNGNSLERNYREKGFLVEEYWSSLADGVEMRVRAERECRRCSVLGVSSGIEWSWRCRETGKECLVATRSCSGVWLHPETREVWKNL